MIESVFAAIVIAICAVLLMRLLIGERRRWRFDAAVRRAVQRLQRVPQSVRRWRETRRATANAVKVADEAIRRARDKSRGAQPVEGEWDGNVYKPKSFRKPPHDKLH